jgi:hypothetical protein
MGCGKVQIQERDDSLFIRYLTTPRVDGPYIVDPISILLKELPGVESPSCWVTPRWGTGNMGTEYGDTMN